MALVGKLPDTFPTEMAIDATPCFDVLDVSIAALQIPNVIETMEAWIKSKGDARYVILGGMHGLMESHKNPSVKSAMQNANLVVMDGMPLVWLARWHGHKSMKRRVYGPELMNTFCKSTAGRYKHFFYGGNDGVADLIAKTMKESCGVQVAGTLTPPFRTMSDDELKAHALIIQNSQADVVWVGVSTPKQDLLMLRLKPLLRDVILLGVGAAFDFNTGLKPTAPRVFQENGLEWAFRLLSEPKRLWYRYLVLGPQFVYLVTRDLLKQRRNRISGGV